MQPFLPSWGRACISKAGLLDVPSDAPSVSVPGPDPDRVLVIGGGPAAGAGAAHHADALPGRLAHALHDRTGRGAVVEAKGAHLALLQDVPGLIADARLERFDVLVVFIGLEDGAMGISLQRWRQGLLELIDLLQAGGARDSVVLLMRIPPASTVAAYTGPQVLLADLHIGRLNHIASQLTRDRHNVVHAALPLARSDGRPGSAPWFERCGQALAELLVPRLLTHAEPPPR